MKFLNIQNRLSNRACYVKIAVVIYSNNTMQKPIFKPNDVSHVLKINNQRGRLNNYLMCRYILYGMQYSTPQNIKLHLMQVYYTYILVLQRSGFSNVEHRIKI